MRHEEWSMVESIWLKSLPGSASPAILGRGMNDDDEEDGDDG